MLRTLITIGSVQLVTMLVMLVRTKALALLLGPEGFGAMSVVDKLVAVISQTLSLSLPFAALRFLPEALQRGPDQFRLLYRNMISVLLLIVIPATAICVALALGTPSIFGAQLVPYRRVLVLAFLGLPVVALVPFLTNAIAGRLWHDRAMRFSLAHACVLLVAAIGGGWWGGLRGVYAFYAAFGAVLVSVAARVAVSGLPRTTLSDWSLRSLRLPPMIWRFAVTLLALAFAAPYATLFVHYTVFQSLGAGSAGYLQAAVGVSLSLRTLLGSAHAVFLTPHVNRQATADERVAWAHTFQRTTCLLFMVLLPPVLLFSDVALRVLYTSKFLPAAPIVGLFIAAEVLTLLSGTYQALILAGNHLGFHLLQNLVAQGLLAGGAALLLPRVGLAGVGVATLLVPLYLFATTVWYLRRGIGFRMPLEVWRPTLVVATTMLVCGIVGSRWSGLSPGLVFAKAGLCAVVVAASLGLLPADDRGALRLQLRALLHKVRGPPLEDAS